MKNLGIKWRVIFLATIPAMIIAALLTSYSIVNSLHALDTALHERGRIIAAQLAPAAEYGVLSGNPSILQPLAQQALTHENDIISILIIDNLGRTLAVSGPRLPEITQDPRSTRKHEWDIGKTAIFSAPILLNEVEIDDYAIASPIAPGTEKFQNARVIGQVYVALSTQALESLQDSLILHNLLIAAVGLVLIGLIAWLIGRGITRPIESLALAVDQLGDGHFHLRVPEDSGGELQTLQHGFNTMAAHLKQAHDEMQHRINEATRQLRHQAHHDALTGLVNRREFERRLELVLRSSHEHGTHHVFCYMDLDQFKIVNDTCGHTAGDELLRQISMVLSNRVRERDTLARLGGDEFGLLLQNCSITDAYKIAENLREIVQDFRFVHQDKIFSIGVSIGMVAITQEMESIGSIMSAADTACYTAKDHGRNRIHLFRAHDDDIARRHGEMEWIGRIKLAMEEDRFSLYCQPILPIKPTVDRRRYFEVLLRQIDYDGKIIPPMAFIPAAERYHLMNTLDRWVIRNTFSTYSRLLEKNHGLCDCVFTINLSGVSLSDKNLLEFIQDQFILHSVPPQAICFEITETSAIVNLANTVELMNALKIIGCRFLLDDFGSGMSSFGYLKNLPVDFLKMDGAFVKDIATNPIDLAMVQSIHSIAQAMDIKTIAEFVESPEVVEMLEVMGVHYGQGFYLGKPAAIESVFSELLEDDDQAEKVST
ncbi:MAG TPA: EAL domain-containing protein [Methylophilaceae bacterium]|nr:EAL domain-containing protein [Methylophilaceae bacterium]